MQNLSSLPLPVWKLNRGALTGAWSSGRASAS